MNIDKLKELEAKATPAKWVHIRGYGVGSASHGSVVFGMNQLDNDGEVTNDQKLVIALRNLAPHLIAVAEAAMVFVASSERMRNAGAEYVKWCEGPSDKADAASSEMSAASTLHGIAIEELRTALTALENA